jgi:hypothetical protein
MTMFVAKVRAGRMMDIEFATGTSLQFKLNTSRCSRMKSAS